MRVNDYLKLDPVDGQFGIEIEMEGSRIREANVKGWDIEDDGSLRNNPECCEFVLHKPLSFEGSIKAVTTLNDKHAEWNAKINWSYRCSTHVHYNVQQMDVRKLLSSIYLYYIFENMLVKWSGKERVGNRFCLRMKDSHYICHNIRELFETGLRGADANATRYSALNLASVREYGSVEFRSLEGTTDIARITKWLTYITKVMTYCDVGNKDVPSLFESAKLDVEALGEKVFGVGDFDKLKYQGWKHDCLHNISLIIGLVDLYKVVEYNEKLQDPQLQQRVEKRDAPRAAPRRKAAEAPQVEVGAPQAVPDPELGVFHEPEQGAARRAAQIYEPLQFGGVGVQQAQVLRDDGARGFAERIAKILEEERRARVGGPAQEW